MGEGVEQRELYLQGQKMRGEEADLAGKAVVRMPHVPGRGAGAAVPDLMQGDKRDFQMAFINHTTNEVTLTPRFSAKGASVLAAPQQIVVPAGATKSATVTLQVVRATGFENSIQGWLPNRMPTP